MGRPSLKTPQLIERMFTLHSAGASAREIAEQLGVNHRTATLWLRDSGLRPNGGYGHRATRERVEPDDAAAALIAVQQSLAELESGAAPGDITDLLAFVNESLALTKSLLLCESNELKSGRGDINKWGKLIQIQQQLLTRAVELRPRDAVKPEDDVTNIESAAETRAKLASLVESAERDFKCGCCGGDPYGRNGRC